MKKLFLMITLVAGLSAATYAHGDKKSPEQRAKHLTKALQKKLNLTAGQASQVNAVFFTQASKMDSLKSVANISGRKSNRFAKRGIIQATDQQLGSILNPDQFKGYEDWKAMRKEKKQEKKHGNAAPATAMPTTQG